ncbi:conjugal transfer protein TraF [Agrobacterium sp. SUL3]|nr:conjugative transfer signal peptidase TraF [Agrobacterium sp. SUL3]KNY31139.1 conjugal transfer protein TraF [Agrobacterium sp. SUL3]
MSAEVRDRRRALRPGQVVVVMLGAAALGLATMLYAGFGAGIRVNTTPSEPLGIWRIEPLTRVVAIGDLVFACMPEGTAHAEGKERGYLRWGLCPGATGPLIKRVVAVGGQTAEVAGSVSINGVPLANSQVSERDGQGRPLQRYRGGVVPFGDVLLHSPYPGSWDSRYFGPIPQTGILGLAREVLTHDP